MAWCQTKNLIIIFLLLSLNALIMQLCYKNHDQVSGFDKIFGNIL